MTPSEWAAQTFSWVSQKNSIKLLRSLFNTEQKLIDFESFYWIFWINLESFRALSALIKKHWFQIEKIFFASFTFAIGVQPSYSYLNNGFFYLDRIGLESVKHFFFPLLFISWRKADVEVSSILCIYSNFIGSYFSLRKRHFMVWKKSCN